MSLIKKRLVNQTQVINHTLIMQGRYLWSYFSHDTPNTVRKQDLEQCLLKLRQQ